MTLTPIQTKPSNAMQCNVNVASFCADEELGEHEAKLGGKRNSFDWTITVRAPIYIATVR